MAISEVLELEAEVVELDTEMVDALCTMMVSRACALDSANARSPRVWVGWLSLCMAPLTGLSSRPSMCRGVSACEVHDLGRAGL